MDFNRTKDTYRDAVEQSVAFIGKGLDFFTSVKADYFRKIVERELPCIERPYILDVGCGHGYIHSYFRPYGYEIVGVDTAEKVLPLASKTNPDVSYVGYNGIELPFASHSFDVAFTICVMHHVVPKQWPNFLREMYRVLRRGGIAVIFEHNPFNPLTRYVVASNDIDTDAVLLSQKHLSGILRKTGFNKVSSRYIVFTPFANSVFRAIDEKLGWLPLGAQYYAIGKAD